MKRLIFASILFCLSISSLSAQTDQNDPFKGTLIPARLKPLLVERIDEFVEVQRQEKWEQIFDFLIQDQKNFLFNKYTDKQKQCIVELIKSNPIVSFTPLKTRDTTANVNRPLNEKVWVVIGEAELKTDSGISKQSTSIAVRYFNRSL